MVLRSSTELLREEATHSEKEELPDPDEAIPIEAPSTRVVESSNVNPGFCSTMVYDN